MFPSTPKQKIHYLFLQLAVFAATYALGHDSVEELGELLRSLIRELYTELTKLDVGSSHLIFGCARSSQCQRRGKSRVLDRSQQQPWSQLLATDHHSKMEGSLQPGWVWYPNGNQVAVASVCSGSANEDIVICAHC